MQMNAYLSFKGQCEEAFRCYQRTFGGHLGTIFRYAGSPMTAQVPADWQDKVMHTTLTLDGHVLMGGDVALNHFEAPKGFSMSLTMKSTPDAERISTSCRRTAASSWRCRKPSGLPASLTSLIVSGSPG